MSTRPEIMIAQPSMSITQLQPTIPPNLIDIHKQKRKAVIVGINDYATAGMIKDDLRYLFNNVSAGVNLDVVLDSCHAGTGTKELTEATPRYIEPPLDTNYFIEANPMIPSRGLMKHTEREIDLNKMTHVLWAACRDYQTASEAPISGNVRGIFTYCFCRALRRAGITVQRGTLEGLVAADIASLGYGQIPRLEATWQSVLEPVFT